MIALALNSGSSSLKFGLFRVDGSALQVLMTGEQDGVSMQAQNVKGASLVQTPVTTDSKEATLGAIVSLMASAKLPLPEAIGHRIVHGGPKVRAHCLIDEGVERDLDAATVLAPLHAPAALAIIRLARKAWPGVPQAACLDTAFHAGMPAIARTLPVARTLQAQGVQRYGFHGLSCESIVRQLGPALPARLIIAHLGSGASITAVHDGRSVDTSMGLTPSGGIVMATRSGDLDPGILIYLLREHGYDVDELEDLVNHQSGLQGISDVSGDLRQLHKAAPLNPDAALAIAMFCMSVAKSIASMVVALGGVDAIVFTGGIGEHDAAVRATIESHLGWLGIELTDSSNEIGNDKVNSARSRCQMHVLPSLENNQIALHTCALVAARAQQ